MTRTLLPLGLAVALCGISPAASAKAVVGKAAPAFSAKDERGKKHTLKQYRGKVVVLEWTNPGCPFVKRHYIKKKTMHDTAMRYLRRKHQRVVWLAVNSSYFNKPADSKKWAEARGLPYRTLQDPSGTIGRAYGAKSTPHMFVIDAKGVVRYAGAIDDDPHDEKKKPKNYVAAALRAVTKGKTPNPTRTTPYGCSVKYKK